MPAQEIMYALRVLEHSYDYIFVHLIKVVTLVCYQMDRFFSPSA